MEFTSNEGQLCKKSFSKGKLKHVDFILVMKSRIGFGKMLHVIL
jgi:hypothetical protein